MIARTRTVVIERVDGMEHARIPARATTGSACFDLAAAEAADITCGAVTLVRTGWRMRAPRGTFLEVRPRSGLGSRGVIMVNAPGTIDRDYSGEIRVPLTYLLEGTYQVQVGDRIGQVRLVEDHATTFRRGKVSPVASRQGGFGSTGR